MVHELKCTGDNTVEFISSFFYSGNFIPHGHCYLWKLELVWLHILIDSLIALSYFSIPLTLIYFVRKRQDVPFKSVFILFGAFIISCGTTHIMGVWTLWHPDYWLSGTIKAVTAIVSFYTALTLIPLVPQALALPSPAQLEAANNALQNEIIERKRVERELREYKENLEQLVEQRTAELAKTNELLQQEVTQRQQSQEKQVFQNLLSNAIKFIDKPQGKITIACTEKNRYWLISITDNDPGIEKQHFERIFKIFQKLTDHKNPNNTGIGLAIVKKITEMYGGEVWVESELGVGSTFFFALKE